mmetsp:Transcript_4196/g.15395  ORF Transcript_4196/g.15395 Transcript_4196/m.15395 type:complete len:353 (-) Transcript_4196:1305-2363(-)
MPRAGLANVFTDRRRVRRAGRSGHRRLHGTPRRPRRGRTCGGSGRGRSSRRAAQPRREHVRRHLRWQPGVRQALRLRPGSFLRARRSRNRAQLRILPRAERRRRARAGSARGDNASARRRVSRGGRWFGNLRRFFVRAALAVGGRPSAALRGTAGPPRITRGQARRQADENAAREFSAGGFDAYSVAVPRLFSPLAPHIAWPHLRRRRKARGRHRARERQDGGQGDEASHRRGTRPKYVAGLTFRASVHRPLHRREASRRLRFADGSSDAVCADGSKVRGRNSRPTVFYSRGHGSHCSFGSRCAALPRRRLERVYVPTRAAPRLSGADDFCARPSHLVWFGNNRLLRLVAPL